MDWNICTNLDDRYTGIRPPAKVLATAHVEHSMISDGCSIEGKIINSVLSPGVKVSRNACIKDSVILHDCVIEQGAEIVKTVLDKDVWVGSDSRIGYGTDIINEEYPNYFNSGISVIGRSVKIAPKTTIGKNCVIFPGSGEYKLPIEYLDSGKTIRNGVLL